MPSSYDGDIRLSVSPEMKTEDIKREAANLKKAINDALDSKQTKGSAKLEKLELQLRKAYDTVDKLQKKLDSTQTAKVPTKEYQDLQKEIERTDKKIQELITRQEKMQDLGEVGTKGWDKLQWDLEDLSEKYRNLTAQKKEFETSGKVFADADSSKIDELSRQLQHAVLNGQILANKFRDVSSESDRSAANTSKLSGAVKGAGFAAKAFATTVKAAFNATKKGIQTFRAGIDKVRSGFSKLKTSASKAFDHVNKSSKHGLKTLIKYGLGVRGLFALFRKLRGYASDAFKGIAQSSSSFNRTMSNITNTFGQFKNSIGTALQPIITIIEPILLKIMNLFINAANAVATFFATLTGQRYIYRAVKANNSYADSIEGTGKAAKEANKQLAEYDKLQVIQQDNASGGGAGGGGGGGFTEELIDPSSSISQFAKDLKEAWENEDFAAIGELVAGKINQITAKIDEAIKWENVGPKITEWVNNMGTAFNSLIDKVDWELIGKTFGDGLNTITYTIETFLDSFNIDEVGTKLSELINAFDKTADWEAIGRTASKGLNELTSAINNFAYNTNWNKLGQDIGKAISELIKNVNAEDLGKTIAAPFETLNQTLNGLLKTFEDEKTWTEAGNKLGKAINSFFGSVDWEAAASNITMGADGVVDTIIAALDTVEWERIGTDIGTLINGVINIDWKDVGKATGKGVTKLLDGLCSLLDTVNWRVFGEDVANFISGIEWGEILGAALKTSIKLALGIDSFLDGFREKFGEAVKKFFTDSTWRKEHLGKPIGEAISEGLGIDSYWLDDSFDSLKLALMQLWNKAMDYLIDKKPWMKWWYEIFKIDQSKIDEQAAKCKQRLEESLEKEFDTFDIPVEINLKGDVKEFEQAWKNINSKDVVLSAEAKEKTKGALATLEKDWNSIIDKNPSMSAEAKEKIKGALKDLKDNWDKVNDKNPILAAEAKEKVQNALKTLKGDWTAIENKNPKLEADAREKSPGALKSLKDGWDGIVEKTKQLLTDAKEKVAGSLDKLKEGWNALKDKVATLTAEAKEKNKGALADLKKSWDAFKSKTVEIGAKLASGVKDWFLKLWDKFKSWFKSGAKSDGGKLEVGAKQTSTKTDAKSWWDKIKGLWGNKKLEMNGEVKKVTLSEQAKQDLRANMSVHITGGGRQVMAKGGVVTHATRALIGEDGPEAVIPLKNNTEWLDIVSKYVVAHMNIGKIDIPHLAKGQVIPPNRQFIAMLGDQRSGTNVETPLKTIEEALENVLSRMSGTGQPIVLQLDGKQIAQVVWSESDKRYKQTGKAFAY